MEIVLKAKVKTVPRVGIFWVFTYDRDFAEYELLCVTTEIIIIGSFYGTHKIKFNSKNHKTYNHKLTWQEREIKENPSIKQYTKKAYNYFPRGRVEIRNNTSTIYMNPHISEHQKVIAEVKKNFLLSSHYISDIKVIADGSEHYKCWMDW